MNGLPTVDIDSDPRVTGEYIRQFPSDEGTLTLVGVVHDHPASVYRVRHVIGSVDPAVLAVELPPISLPLFKQYAATDRTPPAFGGEMSAAMQAAGTAAVVGIDRPTAGFVRQLGRTLLRERPSIATVRAVVANAVDTTTHALVCRAAAALGTHTSIRFGVDAPTAHAIERTAAPAEQARDEREQVRRARSFMTAFPSANRSRAARLEDDAREAAMAARLGDLRENEEGNIVAVVGIDHLDPVAERLNEAAGEV